MFDRFPPLPEQISFTLEGCADDEGLHLHGDLPHCSPSDSILVRYLIGERVFILHLGSSRAKSDSILNSVGMQRYIYSRHLRST
jgi:hypothetical protein